ncbi:MAG: HIT family protein [Gammaproteobacteria bacterium]
MAETIFHKIVSGDIPCHKVYEDEHVLAFLDIFPLSEGHTLIIPKKHAETLDQMDQVHAEAIGRALPQVCRAVMKTTGCQDYNILQNNGVAAHQAVIWVHFHIIPKYTDGSGLGIDWNAGKLSDEQATELAQRIAEQI